MAEKRFVKTYTAMDMMEIWVDRVTGVNYLFRRNGLSVALTPLLGPDGKPVVTPAGEMGGTGHGL